MVFRYLFSSSYAFVSNVSGFGPAILRIHNRCISPPSTHLNNGNTPYVVGYGLWVMGLGNGLRVVDLGNGLWVVGYGLRAWDLGLGSGLSAGCRHGNGHGCAATRPNWRIDWRMKFLGHQICLRVRHYHLSIRNGSLLARHCHLLQLALWYCTHAPFNYIFFLGNIGET